MSKQAQVGAFAILAMGLLFLIFYVVTDFATRHNGYQLGVHFQSAAGLQSGAEVLFSGVEVGTVERIDLLPDATVDVILAVKNGIGIPRDSEFLIQVPLTGTPSLIIRPPRGEPTPYATLPPGIVMPVSAQPQGTNVATIADLVEQGQGELRRFDAMMGEFERREPALLTALQSTLMHFSIAGRNIAQLATTLNGDMATAGANIVQLAQTLNSTASLDAGKVNRMLSQMEQASVALNHSMTSLENLANDKALRGNILATTANIAQTTQTLALLAADLRSVTGNPQTQAQIRDAIANLDATLERANSLLGKIGGKSHVYGVDRGATPAPVPPSAPPGVPPAPGSTPQPLSAPMRLQFGGILKTLAHQLVQLQMRVGELGPEPTCCPSPLLSANQGPRVDVNAILLPYGGTSVMFGANDIGSNTSWNLAALQKVAPDVHLGAGVLYSQLGVLGEFGSNGTGLDARLYDTQHPTLDLYGEVHLTPWAQVFFGERALNKSARRPEYGLQFRY